MAVIYTNLFFKLNNVLGFPCLLRGRIWAILDQKGGINFRQLQNQKNKSDGALIHQQPW